MIASGPNASCQFVIFVRWAALAQADGSKPAATGSCAARAQLPNAWTNLDPNLHRAPTNVPGRPAGLAVAPPKAALATYTRIQGRPRGPVCLATPPHELGLQSSGACDADKTHAWRDVHMRHRVGRVGEPSGTEASGVGLGQSGVP